MAMRLEADGRQNVVENQQEEDERLLDRGIALYQNFIKSGFSGKVYPYGRQNFDRCFED